MSTSALVPQNPALSLPANLRAGDALYWAIQTRLPVGAKVFYVLNGVIGGVPRQLRIGDTGVAVDVTGVATFAVASTVTSAWLPGRYDWVSFQVNGDGNRDQLAEGRIRIQPDPAGTTPVDTRTYNEKLLCNIRLLLENKSLSDAQIYKIGERELTKMTLPELQKWEAQIERRIKNERDRRNGRPRRLPTADIQFGGR